MLPFLAMIPGKGKLVLGLVIALAIAAAVGYHFFTVNSLSNKLHVAETNLATAVENQAKLETAVTQLQSSNNRLVEQRATDQAKLNVLGDRFKASQGKVGSLRKQLSEHDLGTLLMEKPGLLENIVNKGTINVGEAFEALTGGDRE